MKLRKRFIAFVISLIFLCFSSQSISSIEHRTISFNADFGIFNGVHMEFWFLVYSLKLQQLYFLNEFLFWVQISTLNRVQSAVTAPAVNNKRMEIGYPFSLAQPTVTAPAAMIEEMGVRFPNSLANGDAYFIFLADRELNGRIDLESSMGFAQPFNNVMGNPSIAHLPDAKGIEVGIDATGIEGEKIDLFLYVFFHMTNTFSYLNSDSTWTETNSKLTIKPFATIEAETFSGIKIPLSFLPGEITAGTKKVTAGFGYGFNDERSAINNSVNDEKRVTEILL